MLDKKFDSWIPMLPINVFCWDCDSTLSLIEGVDLLARFNGVEKEVHAITERCMATTGLNLEDYRTRLDLIKPTRVQLEQIAAAYITHLAPGARETITILQKLQKKIYIISGGIKAAILPLAELLGIDASHVLAVDVFFDESGLYQGFDENSDLVQPNGKSKQIAKILKANERSLLIGDGFTDWEATNAVTRFIGYAGLNPKAWVQEHADFYLLQPSMLPLLPLSLTVDEHLSLTKEDQSLYEQGMADIFQGQVLIKGYEHVQDTNS